MSAKQDRQGVRTAAQLEQKLNVSERFASIMGIATDARNAAEEAQRLIEEGMSQEEVFNILTNNGQSQGLYRGEDGELYINASYIKSGELIADLIKSGVLQSDDGSTKFNLADGSIACSSNNGYSVEISDGCASLINEDGDILLRISNFGFASRIAFYSAGTNYSGSLTGLTDGLVLDCDTVDCNKINPGKKVLFTGNVAKDDPFTVPNTANYDLFAVKLGTADSTEDTVVLAYKNGNTINGVGGWSGTTNLPKGWYFLSATFSGDKWTVVYASKQDIYANGSTTTATSLNVKEVVGVI